MLLRIGTRKFSVLGVRDLIQRRCPRHKEMAPSARPQKHDSTKIVSSTLDDSLVLGAAGGGEVDSSFSGGEVGGVGGGVGGTSGSGEGGDEGGWGGRGGREGGRGGLSQ